MSFADSLRTPEEKAAEQLEQIEQDPRQYAQKIAGMVERAVMGAAEVASREGKKSVSGYFSASIGEWDISYGLAPDLKQPNNYFYDSIAVIDKIIAERPALLGYDRIWQGNGCQTLSGNVLREICSAAEDEMRELGFRQYVVKLEPREFFSEETKTGFFGMKRTVKTPCGTGVHLWIEVSW